MWVKWISICCIQLLLVGLVEFGPLNSIPCRKNDVKSIKKVE